jgi:hypothetical protein
MTFGSLVVCQHRIFLYNTIDFLTATKGKEKQRSLAWNQLLRVALLVSLLQNHNEVEHFQTLRREIALAGLLPKHYPIPLTSAYRLAMN